jgi:AAA domain
MSPPRRTEPAHSLLYAPGELLPPVVRRDTASVMPLINSCLRSPLNPEQEGGVRASFEQRLSLLWGPPGTGKTSLLAALILGWIESAELEGRALTVGIGSSNWTAIDNLFSHIAKAVEVRRTIRGEFERLLRLVRVRGDHSEPGAIEGVEDLSRTSPEAVGLVNSLEAGNDVLVVGGTWLQLSKLAQRVGRQRAAAAPWFDLLVIDEASQVKVAPAGGYFLLMKPDAHVVLCGDHKQLGPVYAFVAQDSAQGLFDCIFTYMQDTHGIEPVALRRNYRTNIEIATWPKVRFYGGEYEAVTPRQRLNLRFPSERPATWPTHLPWTRVWGQILDPDLPVVAITYPSLNYTLSNPVEAQAVAALALLLRFGSVSNESEAEFWASVVGIITPHRAQASSIRNLLREARPLVTTPRVATVDGFQGQERDVILASYSVADRDFVQSEEEFILDPRRFNVTLTRARKKFVLFTSDALMEHLPADAEIARSAAHLQLFVQEYCTVVEDGVELPVIEGGQLRIVRACLRAYISCT